MPRGPSISISNITPLFFQNGAKSGFEMCFAAPALWVLGPKHVSIRPRLWPIMNNIDYCRFMIGHSLGRMESRIKKLTPHCFAGQGRRHWSYQRWQGSAPTRTHTPILSSVLPPPFLPPPFLPFFLSFAILMSQLLVWGGPPSFEYTFKTAGFVRVQRVVLGTTVGDTPQVD